MTIEIIEREPTALEATIEAESQICEALREANRAANLGRAQVALLSECLTRMLRLIEGETRTEFVFAVLDARDTLEATREGR